MEERFWTVGEGHDQAVLDLECVMAFLAPSGLLFGPAVVMERRRLARPCPEPVVLGYRARGSRDGEPPLG